MKTKLTVLNNDQGFTVLPKQSGMSQPSGVVHLANEAMFDASHYSEPLTQYTVGWKDPADLDGLLDFIAPGVSVPRKFEYKVGENDEPFFSDLEDERAIGAEFKRVEYSRSTDTAKTFNRGLTVRLDKDDIMEGDEEKVVGNLLRFLKRNSIRRGITVIDGAATNANSTWNIDGTAVDPDTILDDTLELGADASGIRPNRMLFSNGSWSVRRKSYRAQNNAGGYSSAGMSMGELAEYLMLDGIRRTTERYVTQKAGTKTKFVAGNIVYAFYALNGVMKDDPSNIKRFWSPCDSGGQYAVYRQEVGSKFIDITVECYETIKATHALGIRKVTVATS